MADKIQEISRETQQLKAKIKSLRDVCSKETQKAQVQSPTPIWYMSASAFKCDTNMSVSMCPGSVWHPVNLNGWAAQENWDAHDGAETKSKQDVHKILMRLFSLSSGLILYCYVLK